MGAIKRRQTGGAVVFQEKEEYGGTVKLTELTPALGHDFS